MNGLIKNVRSITLLFFILLGLLTQSASGNRLKYVLKFNNDSNLAKLHFIVVTDEEAQAINFAGLNENFTFPGQRQFITFLRGQPQVALVHYPSNVVQDAEENAVQDTKKEKKIQYGLITLDGGGFVFRQNHFLALTDIHSSRQAEQPDAFTDQHWRNVILTNLPCFDLIGDHARALGYQRVKFSPVLSSVDYVTVPGGNGFYSANFTATVFRELRHEEEIAVPAEIHLNNAGMPVQTIFTLGSVQFELQLQGYETQEIETESGNGDGNPSAENQTRIHEHEALQQLALNLGLDDDDDDDEYECVHPLLPDAHIGSKF